MMQPNMSKHIQIMWRTIIYHSQLFIFSVVGDDDRGKMLSEQEFEEYKQNVREARQNRLYVVWRNSDGMDCRTIGPASQCFCGH